jgi:hypothetical protein
MGLSFLDSRRARMRRGRRALVVGLVAAGVVSVALGLAIGAMGSMRLEPPRSVELSRGRGGASSSEAQPQPPLARSDAAGAEAPQASPADPGVELITSSVTVQVLNATNAARADDRMVARLRRAGLAVVAVNRAAVAYTRTTVFWSRRSGRPAAVALARRYGWEAARKPGNLSASVTIHVVVGRDEAQ